ncbi:MAG: flagellar hook-basal body protein [Phycisphaerae bacterium]
MSSYGIWLSAAGMQVSDHRQALLANNMANVETTGFKHDLAVVEQRLVESQAHAAAGRYSHPVLDGMTGGINVRKTYQDFTQGPIEKTNRPLDVAIDGDAFFVVSDGSTTRYTRDGEFARNSVGELVLAAGEGRWRVLAESGTPIVFNDKAAPPDVLEDGTIRQGQTVVARLALVTTSDKRSLRKTGENMFEGPQEGMAPASAKVVPRARERGNFNIVQGLASMIEATRAYELNASMIKLQDETTALAVSRIARVA